MSVVITLSSTFLWLFPLSEVVFATPLAMAVESDKRLEFADNGVLFAVRSGRSFGAGGSGVGGSCDGVVPAFGVDGRRDNVP